jgi:hypothetical protein
MKIEDDHVFIKIYELPGCMTEVDIEENLLQAIADAYLKINDAMESWFITCIEDGIKIPLPAKCVETNEELKERINWYEYKLDTIREVIG